MSLRIIIRRVARKELREARDWYETQRPGLGTEFVTRLDSALERIAHLPTLHQVIFEDIRQAPVQQFPYSILYRVLKDRLQVISVFHNRRDPSIWQRRA